MAMKVKICGITREDDLIAAVDAGADLLGFVVGVPSSHRNLALHEARRLITKAPGNVGCVAVTSFRSIEDLISIKRETEANYIQLHGIQDQLLEPINAQSGRVIGAVDARAPEALKMAVRFSGIFQYVLLDTAGEGGLGGTGMTHDWNFSRRVRDSIYPMPLILAGGLTAENVHEAIQLVKPYGVDVSSGIESSLGIKDHDKIFEFVKRAKEARV